MSYQDYVIAAYAIFVVVMLWELVAPKVQIGQRLRAATLRVQRDSGKPPQNPSRRPGRHDEANNAPHP